MVTLKLNGLEFGGTSKYQLQEPISGLDAPPIRMGAGVWSGRDGGYVSAQFFGNRVITFKGFIAAGTCEELDELRQELTAAIPIRQSLPLYINTAGGRHLVAETYLQDVKMDISAGGLFAEYQLTLLCPDPLLYEAGDGTDIESGYIEVPVYKLIGGGYITEYDMPVVWTPGTTPTIAVNDGDVMIYPQVKYTGIVTNPIITNVTENKFVRINITTTQPTDVLLIDMYRRTVTLNGGSVLSFRTLDSTWWGLAPGNNQIEYTSTNGGDTNLATVRYRNGYKGV